MRYTRLVADIRLIPVYTCHRCSCQSAGTTTTVHVDTDAGDTIESVLSREPPPASMPIGWSSHGPGLLFRCPEHTS